MCVRCPAAFIFLVIGSARASTEPKVMRVAEGRRNHDRGGCKSLFVHARWRPLRRAETKRRDRNGEQKEESRRESVVQDEKSRIVAEEKSSSQESGNEEGSGEEGREEATGCQGVQVRPEEETGSQETSRQIGQENGGQTSQEDSPEVHPFERTGQACCG